MTAIPSVVADVLGGKKFLLGCFETLESDRVERVLARAGSSARVAAGKIAAELESADAALLRLSAGIEGSPWLAPEVLSKRPLLAIGAEEELCGFVSQQTWMQDVMLAPYEENELLLRAFRLVAKTPLAKPARRNLPVVLIADDDPSVTAFLKAILQPHGMECRAAANGREALEMARAQTPDLLLLDLNMPGMSGFDVLIAVRRDPALRKLPVVLLTASAQDTNVALGSQYGANDYVAKPVNGRTLIPRVKKLLAAPAL